MQELVVSCSIGTPSSKDSECLFVWSLNSGSTIHTFKGNASSAVTFIGEHIIASPQHDSTTLHLYSWNKAQPHIKSTLAEKLASICSTHDGLYCIGGGISGTMYCWEVSTGLLLASWESHYKKVLSLAVTEDNRYVISAGEDAIINIWNITDLLDQRKDTNEPIKPVHSWGDHSLPVTAICIGSGGRIVSVSHDRTCKVHKHITTQLTRHKLWELTNKSILCSVLFPAGLTAVVMDSAERNLMVGGVNGNVSTYSALTHKIYLVQLFAADTISDAFSAQHNESQVFKGHNQAVSSLAISMDGYTLVSGSYDGTCKVWDIKSKQLLRTFSSHRGPVMGVHLMMKYGNTVETDSFSKVAVQGFKKYPPDDAHNRVVPVTLPNEMECINTTPRRKRTSDDLSMLDQLEESLISSQSPSDLREQNAKWKKISNELYKQCAKQLLSLDQLNNTLR